MTTTKALQAIVARINGEFDCPTLVAFGPLSTNTEADCLAIAQAALKTWAEPKPSMPRSTKQISRYTYTTQRQLLN